MKEYVPEFIMVEGADCVGKTTFSHKLILYLNQMYGNEHCYQYRHLGPITRRVYENRYGFYDYYRDVVQDRYILSDYVYNTLNPASRVVPPSMEHMIDIINTNLRMVSEHRRSHLIIITASPELIESRYDKDREMFSLDFVLSANRLYKYLGDELRHKLHIPVTMLNYYMLDNELHCVIGSNEAGDSVPSVDTVDMEALDQVSPLLMKRMNSDYWACKSPELLELIKADYVPSEEESDTNGEDPVTEEGSDTIQDSSEAYTGGETNPV